MKSFPTIILAIFGVFIVAGVVAVASFGKFGSGGSGGVAARAVLWGTLSKDKVESVINIYNQDNKNALQVTYQQFSEEEFDTKLTEALAENRGPDAIIISNDRLLKHAKKIYAVPFESVPERSFRDTFTEGSELYVSPSGILAFPFLIDPMVLYWNRTLFNAADVALPPSLWEDVMALVPKLTRADVARNVQQSTIALGEYRNVEHAKEILALMIMQSGNPITIRVNDEIRSILNDRLSFPEVPAVSAVRFYTEFANPVKPAYSWNRSLPSSKEMFIRGDLALYLGFSSELSDIREKNPNLNFDVTRMPQVRDAVQKTTFGKIYSIAVINQSPSKASAFKAVSILTSSEVVALWVDLFDLPPARRDMLASVPTDDPYRSVFYRDALISHGFLDADPVKTNDIFGSLIEDVTSGRLSVTRGIAEADGKIDALFDL